jgi:hypothetical protein
MPSSYSGHADACNTGVTYQNFPHRFSFGCGPAVRSLRIVVLPLWSPMATTVRAPPAELDGFADEAIHTSTDLDRTMVAPASAIVTRGFNYELTRRHQRRWKSRGRYSRITAVGGEVVWFERARPFTKDLSFRTDRFRAAKRSTAKPRRLQETLRIAPPLDSARDQEEVRENSEDQNRSRKSEGHRIGSRHVRDVARDCRRENPANIAAEVLNP